MKTNEQNAAEIAAVIEERNGYVRRGLDDRVAECDRVLARYGVGAKAPSKRAEQRPAARHAAAEKRSDPEPDTTAG